MGHTFVVTGATGTIGRRTVEGLIARKAPVAALLRDAAKGAPLAAIGARIVVGSFDEPDTLVKAFAGADTVVLITASNAHAEEHAKRAIAAATSAKVRKVVRISALKADPNGPTDNTR